jgi:hypothetical protein
MRAGLPTAVLTVGDSPNIGDATGERQSECGGSGARLDQSTTLGEHGSAAAMAGTTKAAGRRWARRPREHTETYRKGAASGSSSLASGWA